MHNRKPTKKSIERAIQRAKEKAREKRKDILYSNYLLLLAIVLTAAMYYSHDYSFVLPDDEDAVYGAMAFIWAPLYILYRIVCYVASKTKYFNS